MGDRVVRLSREENRERTRSLLLDAARTHFARAGYAGASVDAIAEAAGFSKGAFYSNFESKEAVFLILLEEHLKSEIAAGSGDVATDDFDAALENLADRYATDRDDQDWCLLSVEFALHAARSEEFAVRHGELYEYHYLQIAKILEELAAKGTGEIADSAQSAAKFVAFRRGLALDRSSHHPRLSQGDVKSALKAFLRKVLSSE
jgi:AcrR family transcriptional regulator